MDRAWFIELKKDHKTKQDLKKFEAFGNIESITIERFHEKYTTSNGDKALRYVKLPEYTVDLLKMVAKLTIDAKNKGEEMKVFRGKSIERPRPQGSKKFTSAVFEGRK